MATEQQQATGHSTEAPQQQLQQLQSQQQQAAASANRILFLVVVSGADLDCLEDPKPTGPRYTRDSLRNLLQLLGCKPRLAFKVMMGVFQAVDQAVTTARQQRISRKTFQVHPHRNGKVYVSLTRADFMSLVSSCASQYSYKISPSSEELKVACSLRERRRCVVVLLCGTSGSGKSTLASILASRLGITTVVSTDSIRHMMRSFISKEQAPLLWASTYQAGEHLGDSDKAKKASSESELAVYGYKAQCELLSEHLELLIAGCEARTQSLICEGVHLNISTVAKLMARHPSVLPFLVFIPSESRHVERMAVRAKYMTLDPNKNRYVRYMGNIRLIQEYLVRKADKYAVPRVDNSNVDRSVGIIHLTVMSCLRRMARGEPVLDPATGRTTMLAAEYAAVLDHLQGEKDRLAAATAAANTSSSSSTTHQRQLQQQLHQQHAREPAGSGLQQQEPGGSSSGGGRSNGKAAAQELQKQQQERAGMPGTSSLPRVQAGDQHFAPPAAALMTGTSLVAEEASGSASTSSSRQAGTAAEAAAAPAAAVGQQASSGAALLCPRPGLLDSRPDGQQQQQGLHTSSSQNAAASSLGNLAGAGAGSSVGDHARLSSDAQPGGMVQGRAPGGQQQQQGQGQQLAAPAPAAHGANAVAARGLEGGVQSPAPAEQQAGTRAHTQQQQQQPVQLLQQQQQHIDTLCAPAPAQQAAAQGLSSNGSNGGADGEAAAAVHTAELDGSCTSSRDMQAPEQPSCGDAAAAASSATGSFDQQEQQHGQAVVPYERQEQQQEWGERGQADGEGSDAGLVSSGEELDRLGELGSSDNEGERFLPEYGSVYESTTCDEHDDYDEAGGLRAWHTGMATALWPSYAHVYAPNTAAATGTSSIVLPQAGMAGEFLPAVARAGAAPRVLRASHSEFGGESAAAAAASGSGGSGGEAAALPQALTGSNAGTSTVQVLPAGAVAAAAMGAGRGHMLPTVYEGQQPYHQQHQHAGREGLSRPPLPAQHTAAGVLSPRSASSADPTASSSAGTSSSGRAAAVAAARGGMRRVVFRSRSSNSLHHSGRHRPRSAGSSSSSTGGGGTSAAVPAAILRQWSAGPEGRSSPEAQAP